MKNLNYKSSNFCGLRPYNWCLIIALLLFVTITSLLGIYFKARKMQAYAEGYKSATVIVKYKEPILAPLPEREANIALIKKVWGKDSSLGLKIARAESGYRTKATHLNTNGTTDEGIFQVNSIHKMPDMLNATANVLYAYTIFLQQGTNPWLSSQAGWK